MTCCGQLQQLVVLVPQVCRYCLVCEVFLGWVKAYEGRILTDDGGCDCETRENIVTLQLWAELVEDFSGRCVATYPTLVLHFRHLLLDGRELRELRVELRLELQNLVALRVKLLHQLLVIFLKRDAVVVDLLGHPAHKLVLLSKVL